MCLHERERNGSVVVSDKRERERERERERQSERNGTVSETLYCNL